MKCEVEKRDEQTSVQHAQPQSWRKPWFTTSESEDGYLVEVYVPGVNKSGVEIGFEDDTLDITARRADAKTPEGWKALRREIPHEDYRLRLHLNVPVDGARIQARVEDGVLTLELPKAEEAKPRQISVK
ncbi:Hsp20/alpha crystallin family protein [Ruficoccus sp. ZRK36]|uniref:Hsp20/alpha crystallin family protein n=1 Tax=Ruficoccus sp. ZRK36 TaxID=2866311 RepID=UPI001C739320|nr:Hsp20/alpha crystallin family protein [Ruficoccus sp. ZRK36]QYY36354.1 Hsp20/alpha crystallin family protein [Ruficoccus sp. ZRK36]